MNRFRPLAVALILTGLTPIASALAQTPERVGRNEPNPEADPALIRSSVTLTSARSFTVPERSSSRPSAAIDRAGTGASVGWWLGPVGITVALAAVGAMSWGAKRFNLDLSLGLNNPARAASRLGVVGSVRLGPKQAVHLVRVGDRVLIIGTGPASAPQAIGEVVDPAELARLVSDRTNSTGFTPRASGPAGAVSSRTPLGRLDQRIGDDE